MYAIGHFGLGYLTGKGSSKVTKTKLNLPLLLIASVLPDADLILQHFNSNLFMHRGPTHSIITIAVFMIPAFALYRKEAFPYFIALLSHPLIGDLPTGGVEMLWPVSYHWFGNTIIPMGSLVDIAAELLLFAVMVAVMLKTGDLKKLLEPGTHNLFLLIDGAAVLLPMFETSGAALPLLLVPASLFWLVLFLYSVIKDLLSKFNRRKAGVTGLG